MRPGRSAPSEGTPDPGLGPDPAGALFPEERERRQRRLKRTPLRDACRACGQPVAFRARGRDRRVVCASCQRPPESCGCPRIETPKP